MGIGIDLQGVEDVRDSIAVFGLRYLERLYTARELRECGEDARRLAARFAAKEATMKALRLGDQASGWRAIAVSREARGEPSIELTGAVAELAQGRGVSSIAVSLTHERDHAAAIVVVESAR